MIISDNISSLIKPNPIELLRTIAEVAKGNEEFDYECFYEILRLRNTIDTKLFNSQDMVDLIEDIFSSGFAYNFVKLLEEHELLGKVFPGIYALIKVDGGHYHNETVYTHVMGALKALDKLGKIPWFVKLSALYHDCGKSTWEISDEGKRRFMNHAQKGAIIVEKDLSKLGFSGDLIDCIKTIVGMHMQQVDGPHSIRKLNRIYTEHNINPKYFFWVRYADNKGSMVHKTDFMYYWSLYRSFKKTLYVKHEPSVSDLVVNGHDLMKVFNKKPGKWLGATLKYLFVGVQERGYENTYDNLISEAKKFMEWYSG